MKKVTSRKPRRAIKKKPVLAIVKPLTFQVQETLLAAAKESNFPLSLLDPVTGFEIDRMAVNINDIGMTTVPTPAQRDRLGFRGMAEATPVKEGDRLADRDRPVFESEAVLRLNPGADTWTMEVMDASNLQKYTQVAAVIMEMFDVNVTVVPGAQKIE